jgi:hypothetical protein
MGYEQPVQDLRRDLWLIRKREHDAIHIEFVQRFHAGVNACAHGFPPARVVPDEGVRIVQRGANFRCVRTRNHHEGRHFEARATSAACRMRGLPLNFSNCLGVPIRDDSPAASNTSPVRS